MADNRTSITELIAMRDELVKVIKDVSKGKERQHDGRKVTHHDLEALHSARRDLDAEIGQRDRKGIRRRRAKPKWRR